LKAFLKRVGEGYFPADEISEEKTNGYVRHNEIVQVEITKPRNLKFHQKWFVLLEVLYNNQEKYNNREMFRAVVLVELGHCQTLISDEGKAVYIPKSISFAKCDDLKFREIYSQTIDLALAKYCSKGNREEIENEVTRILGFA